MSNAQDRQEQKRAYDREYHRVYDATRGKQRLAERRALILAAKDRPCVDCGLQFEPKRMHFDHVRGEKLFKIGGAWHYGTEKLLAEIAKCDVRCDRCHGRRHRIEFGCLVQVAFKVPPEEKQRIQREANDAGMTVSAFLRSKLI